MNDLDLSLLRAFVATAECGSVSAAAQRLARTQGAVSMQLRRLEENLQAKLLKRSSRGMTMTEAGEVLLPYAQTILGLSGSARRALSEQHVRPIRFGMTEDIAVGSLPKALELFAASYPDVSLDLTIAGSRALSEKLALGLLDVVIGDPDEVGMKPVSRWQVPLQWVASRDFRACKETPLPLVLFDTPCTWNGKMMKALDEIGRPWRRAVTTTSLSSIQSAVEAGLGVAVLLDAGTQRDRMKVLGIADGMPPAPTVEFGIFIPDAGDLSRGAIGGLWRFIADELQICEGASTKK
ncbi:MULTISPECIES: LysR substrate-binding domain-containing protein [unclassified Rhizobium]|uniref:LysR family transcriptional regulator n=1 Tax=unclassified Rhizobium TaxID=2613769 RepID=UPI0006FA4941|nr:MULTISPECIES: LysR substrate-binding domain-containing protein [unclassified Rhizobium]KQV33169.1 hypothetical protein ASC86_18610 [Rhizobium sp. Root1212]KRD21629.1 hypothetical protein ASE37_19110 [Rhizobium sp. Root268]